MSDVLKQCMYSRPIKLFTSRPMWLCLLLSVNFSHNMDLSILVTSTFFALSPFFYSEVMTSHLLRTLIAAVNQPIELRPIFL